MKPLAEFPSEGFPIRAVATPDGASVLVTRARAGDLVVYDAASLHGTTAGGAKHTRSPPETRVVALGVSMKDTNERLFGDRFGDSSVPIGVLTDGAGKRVYIAHANADVITEHHLETGELLRTLTAGREPDGMGWSPVAVEAGTEDSAPQEAGGS